MKINFKELEDKTIGELCGLCDKPWNSEYHISDECVKGGNEDDTKNN